MSNNQDPIETVVRRVAEGLGWFVRPGPADTNIIINPHSQESIWTLSDDLIILAAYAESEIHRHGWMLSHDGDTSRSMILFYHEASIQAGSQDHRTTKDYEYNPTDALGRAEAVLRAVDEAIGGGG